MQPIRILDMPPCRMIASPAGMFGEPALEDFSEWMSRQPRTVHPRDYLFWDDSDPACPGFRWLYECPAETALPQGAAWVDFPGGLYAVAVDIDRQTDKPALDAAVAAFLAEHGFAADPARRELGRIITPPEVSQRLGYEQMEYWYPIV